MCTSTFLKIGTVFLAIIGFSSSQYVRILRQGEACTSDGFFRDEMDCGKFYRCITLPPGLHADSSSSVGRYEFQCPAGTVFDGRVSTCNYPHQVDPSDSCANQNTAVAYPPPSAPADQAVPPPSQPQPPIGAYPPQPQPPNIEYPQQPQPPSGAYPAQPQPPSGSYPVQPPSGSYPSQPQQPQPPAVPAQPPAFPSVPGVSDGSYPVVSPPGSRIVYILQRPQLPLGYVHGQNQVQYYNPLSHNHIYG